MTVQDAVQDIYKGKMVECSDPDEYSQLRTGIQEQAGKWIDGGDHLRAMIALEEIKRLDEKFRK